MRKKYIIELRATANRGTRLGCFFKTYSPFLSQLLAFQEFEDPHMERIGRGFSPRKESKHRYLSRLLGKYD